MLQALSTVRVAVRAFVFCERGAATVDWVIVCAGATGAGFVALALGQQTLQSHSANVRFEVQAPHFETSWTEGLAMAGSDTWVSNGTPTPVFGDLLGGDAEEPARQLGALVSVTNGDFGTNTAEGWTLAGSGVLLVYNTALAFNAWDTAAGGNALQTVTTQAGFDYQLTLDAFEFTWWDSAAPPGDHTLVVEVLDATGAVLATQTQLVEGRSSYALALSFTATTDDTTLRFSNPTSTRSFQTDLMIDNVAVTPI